MIDHGGCQSCSIVSVLTFAVALQLQLFSELTAEATTGMTLLLSIQTEAIKDADFPVCVASVSLDSFTSKCVDNSLVRLTYKTFAIT